MTLGIKIFNFLNRISPLNKKIIAILFTLCAAAVFFIFFKNFIFSIFLSICLLLVAVEVINSINEKRTELIHNQLIEFAINLIVMLKAGKSIRSIIMISADIFKPPLKNYLGLLADELKINYSFDDALLYMKDNDARAPEAAIWFLKNCEYVWSKWIPADIAAKVKTALS